MFISTPCCLLELLVGCHVSRHHRRVRVVAGPGNLEVRPKNCQRGSQITVMTLPCLAIKTSCT